MHAVSESTGGEHDPSPVVVGVISDTHGHLDPLVRAVFEDVDHIIHAGDVGARHVLDDLARIAAVTAVTGNMDFDDIGGRLAPVRRVSVGGVRFLVAHTSGDARRAFVSGEAVDDVVVTGHMHAPAVERRDGVLFLNPGSATSPRRGFGPTVALVTIRDGRPVARIVPL